MQELEHQFDIASFLSMSTKTIETYTGLPKKMAELASEREYDIPFLINDSSQEKDIIQFIERHHLHITQDGRFYHLIGENDIGKAVTMLASLYLQQYSTVDSINIGDSENDFSMLKKVNRPYLVKKTDETYASSDFPHAKGNEWSQGMARNY